MIITIRVMTRPANIRSRLTVSRLYRALSPDSLLPRVPNRGLVNSMKMRSTRRMMETASPTLILHFAGARASPMVDW